MLGTNSIPTTASHLEPLLSRLRSRVWYMDIHQVVTSSDCSCRSVAIVIVALAVITTVIIGVLNIVTAFIKIALDVLWDILNFLYLHDNHQQLLGKSSVQVGPYLIPSPSSGVLREVFNFLYLYGNYQQVLGVWSAQVSVPYSQSIERHRPQSHRLCGIRRRRIHHHARSLFHCSHRDLHIGHHR